LKTALGQLDTAVARVQELVTRLAAAVDVPHPELNAALEVALAAGNHTREVLRTSSLHAGTPLPDWRSRADLESAAQALSAELQRLARRRSRERLVAVARELGAGRVRHRIATKTRHLEELRVRAHRELEQAASTPLEAIPPQFPAPDDTTADWLGWFWSLVEPQWSEVHAYLQNHFPGLASFVFATEQEWWERQPVEAPPVPPEVSAPVEEPTPPPRESPAPARLSVDVVVPEPTPRTAERLQQVAVRATLPPSPAPELEPTPPPAPEEPEEPPATARDTLLLVASPPPVPLSAQLLATLPRELQTFEKFKQCYWLDPDRQLRRTPWSDPDFARRLLASSLQALAEGRFAHLWLLASAAKALDVKDVPALEDIEALAAIWARPDLETSGSSEPRSVSLLEQLKNAERVASTATRLRVVLEALRPGGVRLSVSQVDEVIDAANFQDVQLREALRALLKLGSYVGSPIDLLRGAVQRAPMKSMEQLRAELTAAREKLHDEVKKLWSAAGGKIERTHCREAWTEFMSEARPLFDSLSASTLPDASRRLARLKETYEKIADKRGAKYGDRKRMDRAVRSLLEAAQEVVQADLKIEAHERELAAPAPDVHVPLDAYNALNQATPLPLPEEDAFRQLLQRVVQGATAHHGGELALTLRDFLERPSLLESIPHVSLSQDSTGLEAALVEVRTLASPLMAAAILLDEHPAPVPSEAMAPSLPRHLIETGREDLLIHIQTLSHQESLAAGTALQNAQARVYTLLGSATSRWHELSDVAHPIAPAFRHALEEVESLVQGQPPHTARPALLAGWLQLLDNAGNEALGHTLHQLQLRAQELPADKKSAIEEALASGRLADALSLLGGETRLPLPGVRAVHSRLEARKRFAKAPESLLKYTGGGEELRNAWREGLSGEANEEKLRHTFAHFVFDNRRTWRAADLKKRKRDVGVSCELVRRRIAEQGLNPSFVPQLARFREIVITTPPVPPTHSGFVNQTAEFIAKFEHCITLVLVPRLSPQVRDDLLHEFRRRSSIAAAVFDDVDLCRLLNPGGQQPNLVLGLLEIILEQQRWRAFSPFEPQEGQHTKMEMYVGRSDEADKLFSSAGYSRLFSGRKLGKSALLKHVHDTQDGKKLPSGLTLRVLYVPAVGVDSEAGIVDQIEESMRSELEFEPPPRTGTATQRLSHTLESFLKARPTESLLIFLDEADAFVEEQILAYDDRREQCLTWQMRTVIQAPKDKMDLPRVRFVFSGYRVTHRAEGAWANWGDVLRLKPLAPHEAASLMAGPLARLGIDASHEAGAIAYRCGYQPAVIIKFGQQLLEHLESVTPGARRDSVTVTSEHVATVFSSQPVQQEIRTVVWNNFQGNRLGRIIFSALLLEFAELSPGGVVDDAATRVLERIQEISPGFNGFPPEEGAALDVISRHLRDFVGRSLLIESDPTTNGFQLKFPHHLPVLLQEDQTTAIQEQVGAICVSPPRNQDRVRSLLGSAVLSDLAFALDATGTEGLDIDAVIVCAHWAEAIEHPTGGIADRLGFERAQVLHTPEVDPVQRAALPRVAFSAASPEVAERVLLARPPGQPAPLFLGGADLLRWGLRQKLEDGRLHELATLGRLTAHQIQWWFERVRGVEFTGRSPVGDILARTSGIPFLLGLFDTLLIQRIGADGANISEREVEEVFSAFEQVFVGTVRELQTGDPAVRLHPRELELLRIICRASRDTDDRAAFIEAVTEGWPILYGSELPLQAITDADAGALSVLQRLGLLPLRPGLKTALPLEHLAPLPRQDTVLRIVGALEP
jgi:hypothetical protein